MLFSYEILQRLFYDEVRSSISLDMLEDKKWVKMLLLEDKMGILLENSWGTVSLCVCFLCLVASSLIFLLSSQCHPHRSRDSRADSSISAWAGNTSFGPSR